MEYVVLITKDPNRFASTPRLATTGLGLPIVDDLEYVTEVAQRLKLYQRVKCTIIPLDN